MYGLVPGLAICNVKADVELSSRLAARNVPSAGLEPSFGPRPVATKYTQLALVDSYPHTSVKPATYQSYDVSNVFYPGDAKAPWQGFASAINTESSLRNQFFALQDCQQSVYVPDSSSAMYSGSPPLPPPGPVSEPECGHVFGRSTRHDRLEKCEKR